MTRLLLLALALAIAVYLVRRRLALALNVGGLAYLGLSLWRVTHLGDGVERWLEVGIGLSVFAAVWLALWAVVRAREARRGGPTSIEEKQ